LINQEEALQEVTATMYFGSTKSGLGSEQETEGQFPAMDAVVQSAQARLNVSLYLLMLDLVMY
jgi:hypothetical protein